MNPWRARRIWLERCPEMEELPLYEQQFLIVNSRYHAMKRPSVALMGMVIAAWGYVWKLFIDDWWQGIAGLLPLAWLLLLLIKIEHRRVFEERLREKLDQMRTVGASDDEPF